MTGPDQGAATYGELSGQAVRSIAAGTALLSTQRLAGGSLPAAMAILSYRRVLHALDRQASEIVGVMRVPAPTLHVVKSTRRQDQQGLFLRRLRRAVEAMATPTNDPEFDTGPWNDAARTIHTAVDLICTHYDQRGEPRSPDTVLFTDPAAREAAVTQVAAATQLLLHGHGYLRLRMAEAGMPWSKVDDILPTPVGLIDAASDIAPSPQKGTCVRGAWASVTLARAPVVAIDDLASLDQRMSRLRTAAWQLRSEPTPNITALVDIATTAMSVHRFAAHLAQPEPEPVAAGRSGKWEQASAGTLIWTTIRAELHPLRTAAPAARAVGQDAAAIHGLLRDLAKSARTSPGGRHALVGPVRTWAGYFTQIAEWNAATIDRMAVCNQLFIRGQDLVGDDITDVPDLVHAKLTDQVTRAAPSHIARLLTTYRAASGAESPTPNFNDPSRQAPGRAR
jgi:hypothetical protein